MNRWYYFKTMKKGAGYPNHSRCMIADSWFQGHRVLTLWFGWGFAHKFERYCFSCLLFIGVFADVLFFDHSSYRWIKCLQRNLSWQHSHHHGALSPKQYYVSTVLLVLFPLQASVQIISCSSIDINFILNILITLGLFVCVFTTVAFKNGNVLNTVNENCLMVWGMLNLIWL